MPRFDDRGVDPISAAWGGLWALCALVDVTVDCGAPEMRSEARKAAHAEFRAELLAS